MTSRARILLLTFALAACARPDNPSAGAGEYGGTIVVTSATDVDYLLPPLYAGIRGRQATDLLYDRLAEIGPKMNTVGDEGFEPRLADRWTWAPDSLSIAFHVNPNARWHDGVPVRAKDVRFTWEVYADPGTGSTTTPLLSNIDSVSIADSLTAVFWFKRRSPEQFYDVVYQLVIIPEHVLGAVKHADLKTSPLTRNPIGTGRFRFESWEPNAQLVMVADTANYRGRPKLDRIVWTVSPDFTAAVTKLFAGEADVFEALRPENIEEARKHPDLKVVPYPSLQYGYVQFNLRDPKQHSRPHPIFGDQRVRRALTMAVDRQALVRNVFDTLARPAFGPFPGGVSTADTTLRQVPYDLAAAKQLLDSAGWRDMNGDGVREKNGRPFEVTMIVPASSKTRVRFSVLLQEQLRQVGAKLNVDQLEQNVNLARMTARDFDMFIGVWSTDPSPAGIRQAWGTEGSRTKDGANYGSYESPVFDALVDSGTAATDPARQRAYFKRAYQTIVDDAPAVWLYLPPTVAGMHKRIHTVGLRPDGWWARLPDWWIPADERTPRDRIGLRPMTASTNH
jgi:peptide/nickel transport system substrate-binding protein